MFSKRPSKSYYKIGIRRPSGFYDMPLKERRATDAAAREKIVEAGLNYYRSPEFTKQYPKTEQGHAEATAKAKELAERTGVDMLVQECASL